MSSILDVNGLYDPRKRFAFTNITTEEFRSAWGGAPIVIKAGQTVELVHHLAVKLTRELVDKIMIGEAKADEVAHENQPYYRSPKGGLLGIPNARKVYEEKIIRELAVDEESPEMQVLRAEIKDELLRDMQKKEGVSYEELPKQVEEFSQIKSGAPTEVKPEKKPLKVKSIKAK